MSLSPLLQRRARVVAALVAAFAAPACSLDGLLIGAASRADHLRMPDPAPVTLRGKAPLFGAAAVRLHVGAAVVAEGKVAADGGFAVQTDGRAPLIGGVVEARLGGRAALAIVPELPAQTSVLDPERIVELAAISPGALDLGDTSTALALLVLHRARLDGKGLAAIAAGSMIETLIDVDTRLRAGEAPLLHVALAVQRVQSAGQAAPAAGSPWDLDPAAKHLLRDAFAAASGVDADGDQLADGDGARFLALLDAAAKTIAIKACYQPGRVMVALQVRLAKDARNGNCESINPYLWADEKPSSRMFVTGGVHPDTPRCGPGRSTACLNNAQIDAIQAALGGWVPNKVAMADDGTGGDGVAGDGVYTYAFEAPYWAPATAPDGAGVRLAYKFTYGAQGQGWTGSEEFPGNQRILELDDRNGDHLVIRFDHFADETGNKDKANGLYAGCGKVSWPASKAEGCTADAVEAEADLDGDCKLDGWPAPGKVAPLTVPCP